MYDLYGRLPIPLDFGYHCISLQPYGVNLIYFKQRLFDITELIWHWIAMIHTEIRKSEFMAKLNFLKIIEPSPEKMNVF